MTDASKFSFVELGEGYSGDYDPADASDVELLRLDYTAGGDDDESLCTSLPVSTSEADRAKALALIGQFANAHRDLSPRTLVELFSHMDPTWLTSGVPNNVRRLFGVSPVPIVIVVRDPDAANDYTVFDGEAETYDVDLGRSNLSNRDEFLEWAVSHLHSADRLRAAGRVAAAEFIEELVADRDWPDDLGELASTDALLLVAEQEDIA